MLNDDVHRYMRSGPVIAPEVEIGECSYGSYSERLEGIQGQLYGAWFCARCCEDGNCKVCETEDPERMAMWEAWLKDKRQAMRLDHTEGARIRKRRGAWTERQGKQVVG